MLSIPPRYRPTSISINAYSPECLGGAMRGISTSAPTSQTNVQNLAWFYPFRLYETASFLRAWVYNGATANGNWDVGVYDESFARLQSTGAVAQSGTSVLQASTIAWTFVAGRYYLAMSSSSATATFFSTTVAAAQARLYGVAQAASAHVLPTGPTVAAMAQVLMPVFGISRRTVV